MQNLKLSNLSEKLKISSCTVTINNGLITYFSILSLVDVVDEILIFDDSVIPYDRNEYLYELQQKYPNVTIVKKDLGKDLGKKKQHLVDIARNDIVMRWDDDFILYDKELLAVIYNDIFQGKFDMYNNLKNPNISYILNFMRKDNSYWRETSIYRKEFITFSRHDRYPDYPIINKNKKPRIGHINKCLFLHLLNLKSGEQTAFRGHMCPYLCDEHTFESYFEYLLVKSKQFEDSNSKKRAYSYHDVVKYKMDLILQSAKSVQKYEEIIPLDANIDLTRVDSRLITYLTSTFKLTQLDSINFKYERPITYRNLNLFYWGGNNTIDNNFGDILSSYLFRKITGFTPIFYDALKKITDTHYFTIGSILNYVNHNSVVWGTGIINSKIKNINIPKKIHCVRGPRTYNKLRELKIDCPQKFGDPALLLPLFYKPCILKTYKIGIIPHIVDFDDCIKNVKSDNILIINLKCQESNIESIIDQINSCEYIFSSSLHGLIVSHAYKIPAIWLKNKQLVGDDVKFFDYFESVFSSGRVQSTPLKFEEVTVTNLDTYVHDYSYPNLIPKRIADLLETCPFADTPSLFRELLQ